MEQKLKNTKNTQKKFCPKPFLNQFCCPKVFLCFFEDFSKKTQKFLSKPFFNQFLHVLENFSHPKVFQAVPRNNFVQNQFLRLVFQTNFEHFQKTHKKHRNSCPKPFLNQFWTIFLVQKCF